ncbi:MAG: hypothetical protein RQ746_07125 [Bacteroidales bacterium]|nr:hypothetical protein [Bacteroidales bacterium]
MIDSETDQVTDSIKVPLQPNSMVADRFGKLWVLCDGGFEGNPAGHERPALVRINPNAMEIETTFEFGLDDQPTELKINGTGDTLYFLNRHLYRHIVTADTPPQKILESTYTKSTVGGFYGLGIDPYSGDIYLGDAIDQVQRGVVYRYKADITVIDTFRTGINPGFFCFRPE